MVKQYKVDEVKNLVDKLQKKKNIVLTNYSGIKVKNLSDLRKKLREKGIDYKVVKNNLFRRALKESGYSDLDAFMKGPVAVAFTKDDLSEVARLLNEFKKEQEKFSYTVGIMDSVVYDETQIKRIADLPSREVLLSQIMSLINGPARGIATGANQIMASLARGIKAVSEKTAQ